MSLVFMINSHSCVLLWWPRVLLRVAGSVLCASSSEDTADDWVYVTAARLFAAPATEERAFACMMPAFRGATATATASATATATAAASSTASSSASASASPSVTPSGSRSVTAARSPSPTSSTSSSASASFGSSRSGTPSPSPLVAVAVVSAVQSDVSEDVTVTFNVPTNQLGSTTPSASALCLDLGVTSEPSSLLSGARCSWTNSATLVIAPGGSLVWGRGEAVVVSGRLLRADRPALLQYALSAAPIVVTPRRPAPSMLRAEMSPVGTTISVTFNGESSGRVGASAGAASCALLFNNVDLGVGAQCEWVTRSLLAIRLGFAAATGAPLLLPARGELAGPASCFEKGEGILSLKSQSVFAVPGGVASSPEQCVFVQGPAVPAPPTLIVTAPSTVGVCDSIRVDASLSRGRELVFAWSVAALNPEASSAPFLGQLGARSPYLVAPSALLVSSLPPGSTFNFTVVVSTALGGTGARSVVVSVGRFAVPVLSVVGGSVQRFPRPQSGSLPIVADGRIALCGDVQSQGLQYQFSLESATPDPATTTPGFQLPVAELASTRSPTVYNLNNVAVGGVYVVRVVASFVNDPSASSSALVTLEVVSSGVSVRLLGGNREVGDLSSFALTAVAHDLDAIPDARLTYAWSCGIVVDTENIAPCYLRDDSLPAMLDASTAGFPPAVFFTGVYTFSVTVSAGQPDGLIPNHYRYVVGGWGLLCFFTRCCARGDLHVTCSPWAHGLSARSCVRSCSPPVSAGWARQPPKSPSSVGRHPQ